MSENKFPHVQLPLSIQELLMLGEITKEELICWLAVKSFDWTDQGKGQGCTASQSTIAKVMNVSRKNANPHIQSLVQKGLLKKIDQGKGKPHIYICVIPEVKGIHPALSKTKGVPQTGHPPVPQTGHPPVPQTGHPPVPQTGHKEYKINHINDNHIKPNNQGAEVDEAYKKDPLYSEYDHVKVGLGWLVKNDQVIFNSYKRLVESTGLKSFEIMQLWGDYCDFLQKQGVKDFDSHINEFLGKEAYNMVKQKKKASNVIKLPQALQWQQQEYEPKPVDPEKERQTKEKIRQLINKRKQG